MFINKLCTIIILLKLSFISDIFSWNYHEPNRYSNKTLDGHNRPLTSGRIIGGSNARRHQFPFIVAVYHQKSHLCGGVIVSPIWIVSAAHCYSSRWFQYNLRVFSGILVLDEQHQDVQVRHVVDVFLHPEYQFRPENKLLINDIALLKLHGPLIFNHAVKPAYLPRFEQDFSGTTVLMGWGYVGYPSQSDNHLKFIRSLLITFDECKQILNKPSDFELYPSMVCILPYAGQSSCNGDSGSPLIQNGVLVGITSWGDDFCGTRTKERIPGVFTKVSHFIPFLTQYIRLN